MVKFSYDKAERALKCIAEEAFEAAKDKCPVRTGRLRNSITLRTEKDSALIYTDVEYAASVELGAENQRPQPYLSHGISEAAKKAGAIFREELL